jgi:hypothetical protein
MQQRSERKAHTMRRKYFGEEYVFEFIWQHCDNDGIWSGDASTVAAKFGVSEDEAYDALSELCDRGLIEKLVPGKFAIARWPERDDASRERIGVVRTRWL